MDKTLPPGWTGDYTLHHIDVGGLQVQVKGWRSGATGVWWSWIIRVPNLHWTTLLRCDHTDHKTAAEARADALSALETFARKLLEEVAKLREVPDVSV
jgi:hypothetical protein